MVRDASRGHGDQLVVVGRVHFFRQKLFLAFQHGVVQHFAQMEPTVLRFTNTGFQAPDADGFFVDPFPAGDHGRDQLFSFPDRFLFLA